MASIQDQEGEKMRTVATSWTEWIGQEDLGLWEIAPPKTKPTIEDMHMLCEQVHSLFQLVLELELGYTAIEKRSKMEDNVFSRALFIRKQILKPEHQFYNKDGDHVVPSGFHNHSLYGGYPFPIYTPLWDEWAGGLYAEEPHEWELDPRHDNTEELLQAIEEERNQTTSEKLYRTIYNLRLRGFHEQFFRD